MGNRRGGEAEGADAGDWSCRASAYKGPSAGSVAAQRACCAKGQGRRPRNCRPRAGRCGGVGGVRAGEDRAGGRDAWAEGPQAAAAPQASRAEHVGSRVGDAFHVDDVTPSRREAADTTGDQLVAALAVVLTVHCARAAARGCDFQGQSTPFHAANEPDSGIRDYLTQIRRRLRCSKECLILALVYLDRIVEADAEVAISNLTVHRLLLTAILVASKFQDYNGFDNARYAKIGGLDLAELNGLERDFCRRVGWRLHVKPEEYGWYCDLVSMAAPNA